MSSQAPTRPSPLACSECRKRHLKCDAIQPVCGRCTINDLKCAWTPSRRGGVSRSKRNRCLDQDVIRVGCEPTARLDIVQRRDIISTDSPTIYSYQSPVLTRNNSVEENISAVQALSGLSDSEEEHLTNLFYSNFYPAHPLLVPRTTYDKQTLPVYLRLTVCFVGSHYATVGQYLDNLRGPLAQAISTAVDQTAQRVQALVLYAIVLHASHQAKEAATCISAAAKLAIEIGLHTPGFATDMANQDPQREECLRRTWWELYIVDGYMAALSRNPSFLSNGVGTHPYLPCEDPLYARGICGLDPLTLDEFDDRVFMEDTNAFSSYCYRIDAMRIIARVLAIAGANDAVPDEVQAVDNAIASWKYHLPSDKADVIDQYGNVDHMLFQANVFIQWATILLHFPRSDLPLTVPTNDNLACAKDLPRISATSAQHTVKAVAASKELSNLAALPWCVTVHSPFFTCGLILGCIVQLSACSSHARNCLQQHRDRVTLMIGALKTLGETWAIARNALQHLMKVAHGIFCSQAGGISPMPCSSTHDSAIELSTLSGEMSWFDLFQLDELPSDVPGIITVAGLDSMPA